LEPNLGAEFDKRPLMALYFFHLIGRVPVEDDEGEEFSTPAEAVAAAEESARDLAANREPAHLHGQTLRLTNEAGAEVGSFKLDAAGTPWNRNASTSAAVPPHPDGDGRIQ